MPVSRIADPADSRIADYGNVPDPELVARRGLFVAEGRLVVERLLSARAYRVRSAMVTETALAAIESALTRRPEVPVFVVPQAVMNAITGFDIHRGCLALGERPPLPRWQDVVNGATRIVVMERIGNADNVGAIVRNAAAFHAGGILIGPSCADPLYRKAIRTSMGAALGMRFAAADPLADVLRMLANAGWAVVGLTLAPDAPASRDALPALRGRQVAVVAGHEGEGLTPDTVLACTHRARIPMSSRVDSLNVATATAVALYELDDGQAGPRDGETDPQTRPSRPIFHK